MYLGGSAKGQSPGLVIFVPAFAYHFCHSLPATFTQPGVRLLTEPFSSIGWEIFGRKSKLIFGPHKISIHIVSFPSVRETPKGLSSLNNVRILLPSKKRSTVNKMPISPSSLSSILLFTVYDVLKSNCGQSNIFHEFQTTGAVFTQPLRANLTTSNAVGFAQPFPRFLTSLSRR